MSLSSRSCILHSILICALFILSSCVRQSQLIKKKIYITPYEQPEPSVCQQPNHVLTVWIHGTKFGLDTLYKKTFNAKPGLKHVHELPQRHPLTKRMKALADQCADFFPYESVYCFCWSGKLRSIIREEAAHELHQSLFTLINNYQKQHGHQPNIRLVCHSHGANVALNLARINAHQTEKVVIDSLILFACPVQCATKDFVRDATFKRIYSFYSPLDLVQILAPQWRCCIYNNEGLIIKNKKQWLPLSERRFAQCQSLRQAWVKKHGSALSHSDFTSYSFLRLLPKLLAAMDEAYEEHADLCSCTKELILHIRKK